MIESVKTLSKKAGLPPGALVHIGKRKAEKVRISILKYSTDNFLEKECEKIDECITIKDEEKVSWINIDGLHNTEIIADIGKKFDLHPLLLEDVLNTRHRPKVEEFDNYLFLSLKMIGINSKNDNIEFEQVSLVLGKKWLISFQEQEGDIFDSLRHRIRESKGNIRHKETDYLLYRLIDTVVDNYFYVIEFINEATDKLEERILNNPDKEVLHEIQHLKKQVINFRKAVYPLRETISTIQKDNAFINENTMRYLRDVYEHIIQLIESIDTERDTLANLTDLYHTGISNRMNQVMQVLTIIATIFIPLTFIAGIYGMNFDNMPELHWKYGYFAVWGIMLILFMVMILFFKRKKWM